VLALIPIVQQCGGILTRPPPRPAQGPTSRRGVFKSSHGTAKGPAEVLQHGQVGGTGGSAGSQRRVAQRRMRTRVCAGCRTLLAPDHSLTQLLTLVSGSEQGGAAQLRRARARARRPSSTACAGTDQDRTPPPALARRPRSGTHTPPASAQELLRIGRAAGGRQWPCRRGAAEPKGPRRWGLPQRARGPDLLFGLIHEPGLWRRLNHGQPRHGEQAAGLRASAAHLWAALVAHACCQACGGG
jgi:hypothetical protein